MESQTEGETKMTKYERRLRREGAFLMLTHREGYATDDGHGVPRKAAIGLTGDLFAEAPVKGIARPAEDGLFPGFSQTWRI